jgi:hypothetical protein
MSWKTNQVFEFYSAPGRIQVRGGAVRTVMTVPASDLQALHSYAVVVTGYHGNYETRSSSINNAANIKLAYNGIYVPRSLHRFDLTYAHCNIANATDYGQSFTIIGTISCGATPADLTVEAECEGQQQFALSLFEIDGLSIQVYDMTAWSDIRHYGISIPSTALSHYNSVSSPLLSATADLTHGSPAKKWLVWYSVVLEGNSDQWIPATWMMLDTTSLPSVSAQHAFEYHATPVVGVPNGSWLGTSTRGRYGYYHQHHIGSARVLEVDAAGVRPSVWAADLMQNFTNPALSTKAIAANLLAIPLDDISDEVHHEYVGSYSPGEGEWAPASDPAWKTAAVDTDFYDTIRVLSIARCAYESANVSVRSFASALEVDSSRLSPIPFAPHYVHQRLPGEVQALHRLGKIQLDTGTHCLRHILWHDGEGDSGQVFDHQFLVLSTAKNYGFIYPPGDIIGPEIVIVPGRESIDVSGLAVFPIKPNVPSDWEELDPSFEARTRTGYTISWPLSLEPRRRCTMTWSGITEADKNTLLTWLRQRVDSGAAIAWQPPDVQSDLPFVLNGETMRWSHQSGGKYEISVQAIELRYTGV